MAWVIGIATFIAVGGYQSGAVDIGGAVIAFVFWFIVGFAIKIIIDRAKGQGQRPS